MKLPPVSFNPGGKGTPGTFAVYNGRPTLASDALDVDKYATWLAAVRKFQVPVHIGSPYTATNTATAASFAVLLPAYTQAIRWHLLCTGNGSVTLTCDDDAFNVVIPVIAYDNGQHVFANAAASSSGPKQTNVVANGLNRASDVTFGSAWRYVTCTAKVTDESAGVDLKVWMLRPFFVAPFETSELPV